MSLLNAFHQHVLGYFHFSHYLKNLIFFDFQKWSAGSLHKHKKTISYSSSLSSETLILHFFLLIQYSLTELPRWHGDCKTIFFFQLAVKCIMRMPKIDLEASFSKITNIYFIWDLAN